MSYSTKTRPPWKNKWKPLLRALRKCCLFLNPSPLVIVFQNHWPPFPVCMTLLIKFPKEMSCIAMFFNNKPWCLTKGGVFFGYLQQSFKAFVVYFNDRMGASHHIHGLKYCFFDIVPRFPLFCKFLLLFEAWVGGECAHPNDGSQSKVGWAHCVIV